MNDPVEKLSLIAQAVFENTPVLFAYLYGSYAMGTSHPFSDLDVAVFVEEQDMRNCLELELSLSLRIDEKLGHEVQSDLRVLNLLPLTVKGIVLADGKLIYSKDENKRIEFEAQVRTAYFDFLPIIRLHRNAYREKIVSERESGIS
jgi:predicted nucleotidyltransferase